MITVLQMFLIRLNKNKISLAFFPASAFRPLLMQYITERFK